MDFSNKGKSMTTSVPSMAIRFNATAEEIEEIYLNEDEQNEPVTDNVLPVEKNTEVESSPRRSILPLLGKRSTSVDVNTINAQDSSPPSDPWRFLSDIKGKITKSVEVKFTEYKSRTMENDSSPKIAKAVKDSKENSSLSDSEEASESSISKTCGVVSTTEGVEMSSDDETPSLSEEDKQNNDNLKLPQPTSSTSLRQRFRIMSKRSESLPKVEGTVGVEFLQTIQQINMGEVAPETSDIESGIDVLASLNVANFEVDSENVLNIGQVSGSDIRAAEMQSGDDLETVFSPFGFVDLRRSNMSALNWSETAVRYRAVVLTLAFLCIYFFLPLSIYTSGFIAGGLVLSVMWCLYIKVCLPPVPIKATGFCRPIVELPGIKEHHPLTKFEGWINEFPEEYDPLTYHVSRTQPVYLRLQGNFLKVSHTRQKIPKRAMWNEPEHKYVFTRHRIYNLVDAKVLILPEGLARVRHWSKKYPICIVLNKDQVNYVEAVKKVKEHRGKEVKPEKKSDSVIEMQIFSKLVENLDEQSETSTSKFGDSYEPDPDGTECKADAEDDDEDSINVTEWHDIAAEPVQINPDETRIYFFTRTCREKEDWFRRLRMAANRSVQDDSEMIQDEYSTYMRMQKVPYGDIMEDTIRNSEGNCWLNAMIARIMFDCVRHEMLLQRIKERVQRKLASIKLPHFIQELFCEELNLGTSTPIILGSSKPILNDRGLWLDLDISYEGLVMVILQTKVNLLKLKHPHVPDHTRLLDGKPAIYHSDIDDSAESTTDEESPTPVRQILDEKGYPVPTLGGISNRGKRLMKMVDRIAESKFFQAATENKYIKKAMQDLSNTDLRLKVEIKKCIGRLVINIPPPPTDRIWLSFRTPPELLISAHPIVGDRNIGFMKVTSWIEKKIYKEFLKVFVIPNMEDLLIPVMSPNLPQ